MSMLESYFDQIAIMSADKTEKDAVRKIIHSKPSNAIKNVEQYINSMNLPVIEVAGPTLSGYVNVDLSKIENKRYVSNLAGEDQVAVGKDEKNWKDFVAAVGAIDFQADGRNLPFKENSIGTILIKALPNSEQLSREIIDEVKRVLVSGGAFVLEGNLPRDVVYALENGFEIISWKRTAKNFLSPYEDIVLRKL